MTQEQIQNDIHLIKQMIEKSKRETAESGLLFIIPGILVILMVIVINILEANKLHHLFTPVFLISISVIIAVSMFIGFKEGNKVKVETYAKRIFGQLWMAVGIAGLITGCLFPLTGVYLWSVSAVVTFLILGIGFFVTGALFDLPFVKAAAFLWWIGACSLAFVDGPVRLYLIIAVFLFGYILPGIILNRQYAKRSQSNAA